MASANVLPIDEIIGSPQLLNLAADSTVEMDMPRTMVEEYWDILLKGTLTNAGYTTAPSKYVESVEQLIRNVIVIAVAAVPGGVNEQFKNIDASYLRFITNVYTGADITRTDIGTANAAYAFNTTPRLWFTDPRAKLPDGTDVSKRTMLDARLLSSLKLDIAFTDPTAMLYGGVAGTSTFTTAPTLQIKTRHYANIPNLNSDGTAKVRNYLREVQQNYPVAVTGVDTQFNNLRTGAILHRLIFKGLLAPAGTTTTTADPSDVPLGSNFTRAEGPHIQLRINQGGYVPLNSVYQQLQYSDQKMYKLTNGWRTGYAVYEPSPLGNPLTMLNLQSATNMQLVADTTAGATNTSVQLTYVEQVTPAA
jgi:hypothetical protein